MNKFEDMAWAYSDSMREDETTKNDDMATAYYKGFKAGAKAIAELLKNLYEKSGDADVVFESAHRLLNGTDTIYIKGKNSVKKKIEP